LLKLIKKPSHAFVIFEILNDHSGNLINDQLLLKPSKNPSHAVIIFEVLKDHSGKLINAQLLLKVQKKLFQGLVLLFPNPSANDGIDDIFIHDIVVPSIGTSGFLVCLNVHLVDVHVKDKIIVCIPVVIYV
jgi:hypothetical protein